MSTKEKTLNEVLEDDTMSPKEKYNWYVNKSREWPMIRKIVLNRDGWKCQCCDRSINEAVLTVHHSTYKHLFREYENNYEDLITLCPTCHYAIHKAKSNILRFTMKTKREDK